MNRASAEEGTSPQEEDKARILFGSRLMVITFICYLFLNASIPISKFF